MHWWMGFLLFIAGIVIGMLIVILNNEEDDPPFKHLKKWSRRQ